MPTSIAFSGVVVCFNEERHLEECLQGMKFCEELIVIDLGSTDESISIAKRMGAKVVPHEWVAVVEQVREFAVKQAKNDWIVFLDPDIILPLGFDKELQRVVLENPKAGIVNARQRNYFIKKPVMHGRWGGKNVYHPVILHRDRVKLTGSVHRGINILPGFEHVVAGKERYVMAHYWINSWEEFRSKVNRYIENEGKSRFAAGQRIVAWKILPKALLMFIHSLVLQEGFLDGWLGFQLSYLAAKYEYDAYHSLLRTQNEIERKKNK